MSKDKKINTSDYKCVECGKQAEVWWTFIDPDIPPHPYCRKCAEKAHRELLFRLFGGEKRTKMRIENQIFRKYFQ